jgi:putative heme iron utilization protein
MSTIEARQLLRQQRHGVLSTLSKKLEGYPFGSVTPFVLDHQARPVILISTLAEHTKNIEADPRVSLLAHDASTDIQANARVTVVGNCARMEDQTGIRARYLRYFPGAADYFATHDFFFYRIEPAHIRFIGGFGAIHWIEISRFFTLENQLATQEEAIIAHMNADHQHNLTAYCRHVHGVDTSSAHMIGIDTDGFDVRTNSEQQLRFDFSEPVLDAQSARSALVAMAEASRA